MLHSSMDKVSLWVKLKKVPCSLITQEGLSYIGSTLGNPLYMDKLTESRTFVGFARICIEMDLTKPLLDHTFVKLRNGDWVQVEVEYTWKPQICSSCKIIGHTLNTCPNATKQNAQMQHASPRNVHAQTTFSGKKDTNNVGWRKRPRKIWVSKNTYDPKPFASVVIISRSSEENKIVTSKDVRNRFSILDGVNERNEEIAGNEQLEKNDVFTTVANDGSNEGNFEIVLLACEEKNGADPQQNLNQDCDNDVELVGRNLGVDPPPH